MVGLGLWYSIPATFLVEGLLMLAGIVLYLRATRAVDRIGTIGLWTLLAFLTLVWGAGPFSPPPPSTTAVSVTALALVLVPLWAAWVHRHRQLVLPTGTVGRGRP